MTEAAGYDLFLSHATPDKPWVRTLTQELEAAQALEAVDDQVRAFLLHHHDRHLLTLLGERGQQATLALGAPQT